MRDLKVVDIELDGKRIICEDRESGDKFVLRVDDRLRTAICGDKTGDKATVNAAGDQNQTEIEAQNMLRPKEIQAKIRAGASVEQVAAAAGASFERVERFAHPVLLERARAAELATAAHPVLADGPSVLTLLETVTTALVARGLDPDTATWDAWRNEDTRWTVQMAWKAGRTDNLAHFRFVPGAHGGTVDAVDDTASELIDPNFARTLRPLAAVPQLDFDEPAPAPTAPPAAATDVATEPSDAVDPAVPDEAAPQRRSRKGKPPVPAWEDVLLGVRSSGSR